MFKGCEVLIDSPSQSDYMLSIHLAASLTSLSVESIDVFFLWQYCPGFAAHSAHQILGQLRKFGCTYVTLANLNKP